jgi:hypothetical protein
MVIEEFVAGAAPVYERASETGRLLPAWTGVRGQLGSQRGSREVFQLVETDDPSLVDEWAARESEPN